MSRRRTEYVKSIREGAEQLRRLGYRYHRMSWLSPGTSYYKRADGRKAQLTENADSGVVVVRY